VAEKSVEYAMHRRRRQPRRSLGFRSYCQTADVARGLALALEQFREGFEAYHLSADTIISDKPLGQMVAEDYGGMVSLPADWPDFRSPMLHDKARAHFGWKPEHDLHDVMSDL
jgi:nucleoside-diphosphate-sugar epimerase